MFVSKRGGGEVYVKKPTDAARPRGCWTVKQKNLLCVVPATIKFCPIIAHKSHPCRAVLGRALSLLVSLAVACDAQTPSLSHANLADAS